MSKLSVTIPEQRFLIDDDFDIDNIDNIDLNNQYDSYLSDVLSSIEYEWEYDEC